MHEAKKNELEAVDNFSVEQLSHPKSKFDKERADSDQEE